MLTFEGTSSDYTKAICCLSLWGIPHLSTVRAPDFLSSTLARQDKQVTSRRIQFSTHHSNCKDSRVGQHSQPETTAR